MELTGKQRRFLRSKAHSLKPVVQIGRNGVNEALQAEVLRALADHELIKIKGPTGAKEQIASIANSLTDNQRYPCGTDRRWRHHPI